ncbi:cation-transporting ATPase 1, putative [Plasmodium relictum]|uniref:Cation-transporting ATPase n=1 Tax=Plasmodium relictum TaxID=85471 RepID=A0A1J1H6F3_PLARL|nr:cation-transporting ATPase 1, putative [Plasmodium relictum]CRH00504.1 cation-transporting ATPase 1, putative [Plasmodium relictum]
MYNVFDYYDKKRKYKVLYKTILTEDKNIYEYQIDYVECYKLKGIIKIAHYFFCVLSSGLLPLILSWFPIFYFKLLHSKCTLNECEKVLIVTKEGKKYIEKIKNIQLYNDIRVVLNDHYNVHEVSFYSIKSFCSKNLMNNCKNSELKNNENDIQKYYSDIEDNYEKIKSYDEKSELDEYEYSTHIFEFLGVRYVYVRRKKCFVELYFYVTYPLEYIHLMSDGLNSHKLIRDRKLLYGECNFNIKLDSVFVLLFKEIIHPFFIFQIFAMIIWSIDSYYEYALAILFITAISTIIELRSTRLNQKKLKNMIDYKCEVKVHRYNSVTVLDSSNLVPGDVYEIENNMKIPCDTILLIGSATMSEHMLTGESVPVNKSNLPFIDEFDDINFLKQKKNEKTKLDIVEKHINDIVKSEKKKKVKKNSNINNNYNNKLTKKDEYMIEDWNNKNMIHQRNINMNNNYIICEEKSEQTINKYHNEKENMKRRTYNTNDLNSLLSSPSDSSSTYYERKKKKKKKKKKELERKYEDIISKHTLYAGTTVLSVNSINLTKKKNKVLGLVIKTGFITTKGKIINNILYSKKARLNLIQDSYKFLAILAIYALASGIIVLFMTIINNIFSSNTIIRCLDLITDAVPPALPTTLTVGITIAVSRLKKKFSISCISPSRINLAGQINTMVFDKTGTLTENRLDFLGVIPNKNRELNDFIPISNYGLVPDLNACNFVRTQNNNNVSEIVHLSQKYSFEKKDNNSLLSTIKKCINSNNVELSFLQYNKNIDDCEYHNFDEEIKIKKIISREYHTLNNGSLNNYDDNNNHCNLSNCYNDDRYNLCNDNSNNYNNFHFYKKENFNKIMKMNHSMFHDALACCHSLTKINNELIGDVLEILMFRSTNCDIQIGEDCVIIRESENLNNNFFSLKEKNLLSKPIYYILKQFEFNSNLQRMSVIVKNVQNEKYYLFCKGSPEKIKELCLKNKIPDNYDDMLHKYAKLGMRIISLSYKELDANNYNVLNITRNSLEKNLLFLGFLIFANKLKNSAYDMIKNLKSSGCQCIMSTGDNILTSISIAKQCGIINENIESLIIGDVATVKKKKKIVWYVDKNDKIFKNEDIDRNIDNKKKKNNDKDIADSNNNNNNNSKKQIFENGKKNNTSDIAFKINENLNELCKNKESDRYEEDIMKNNNKCHDSNISKNLEKGEKKKIEKYPRNSRLVFDDLCELLIHRDPRSIGIVISGEAFIFLKKEFERLDLPFYDECEKITYNVMENNSKKKKNKIYYNSKIIPKYIENLHNKNFCYNKLFYKIQSKLFENLSRGILKKKSLENNKNYMRNKSKDSLIYEKYSGLTNSVHLMNINNSEENGLVCLNNIKNKEENQYVNLKILKNKNKSNFLNIKNYIKITQKRKIMDALLIKHDSDEKEVLSESLRINSLNNKKSLKKKKLSRFNDLTKNILSYPKPLLSLCIIKEKNICKVNYFLQPKENFILKLVFRCTNYFFNLINKKKKKIFREPEHNHLLEYHSSNEENYKLSKLDSIPENQFKLDIYGNTYKKKNKGGGGKKKNVFFLCNGLNKKKIFFKNKIFNINNEMRIMKRKEKRNLQNSTTFNDVYFYSNRKYKKLKEDYLCYNNNSYMNTLSPRFNKEKNSYKDVNSILKFNKYRNNRRENVTCLLDEQKKCIENNENVKNDIYLKSNFYKCKSNFKNSLYYKYTYQMKKKKNKIINKKNIIKNKLLMNNYLRCLKQSLYHECKKGTCYRYSHIKNVKLSIYEYILRTCTVYARMKPEYKTQLILSLKNLPHMPFIGMCGDGSNDCGALNCADIGVSLSHNESSICAPFTSDNFYLNSVINILVEGRAALVNSFQLFKFISLYSVMQCSVVLILYAFSNNLTDNQFIFTDIFTILPLSIFMSWTSASEKLSSNLPLGKLFCFPVLFSIYGQIIIQLFFIFISLFLLFYQPFYKNDTNAFPLGDAENKKLICTKNTLIFIISSFQILFICISLNIKTEWRKSVITNVVYVAWILILILVNIFITIFSSHTCLIGSFVHFLKKYLNLVTFPVYFRFYLSFILIINFICTYYFEKYLIRFLEKKEMKKNYKHNHINSFPVPNELDTKVFVTCL